ncbi:MAG TPA: MASE1 domain-containing protein, partial [Bryobacteraceae bacterium]|nr:MASE1 domain-containing protein [Bryobacteraceae bacterium]
MANVRSVLVLALVYLVAAKLGLRLAVVHPYATAVWPPTGIAIAALLLFGRGLWPGIALGAYAANLTIGGSVTVAGAAASVGIAAGNTLEAVAGAYLVERFAGGMRALDRPRDVIRFAALAAAASTLLSAAIGVLSLSLAGLARWQDAGAIGATWWIGDAGGDLVVAPALLLWFRDWRIQWNGARALEAALATGSTAALALISFSTLGATHRPGMGLAFVCTAPLLWLAFRFGRREAAAALLLVDAIAIWAWLRGMLSGEVSPTYVPLELQAYMGITSIMLLAVAAEVFQRHRQQAELAHALSVLKSTEARFQALYSTSQDALLIVNDQGVYVGVNQSMCELLKTSREQLVGSPFAPYIPPERLADAQAAFQSLMASGRYEGEFPLRAADGVIVDLEWRSVANFVPGLHCCVARDVRERNRFQEQLQQTQKLESLGVLAGGIAHDFNNLLLGILGNASLALDILGKHAAVPMLQDVMSAAERAAQLTRQLLAYAGKAPLATAAVDLNNLVAELTPLLHASIPKTVHLNLQLESGVPPVEADQVQLQQVIMNMVINGAEAIPEGHPGTVTVATSARPVTDSDRTDSVVPFTPTGDRFVGLTFSDTGNGIAPGLQRKIFDPFFSTKFAGRGLGLSAVLGIVRSHRGGLTLRSTPGHGTTF